ncbi:uncharacterized protein BO97DRAFT_46536 [Aspergillus homomorphus CBS 101889]|uniref:Uncharacterized protein n=1 Tax=Aspergillus homomorphus (strain CBS 101889) TaxID=1450537 RepID=A0A395HJN3_ASPHC|nr:hypothetical protein BO97DRAFT_46536 [Aspergillus homomorphus CBS 101889]RAL06464.1 hypothetical protein BO97DRAFT_46536 [Aspergillus homomorphus CBS 101889]
MEYPVDPQVQQENRFSDIASLWDRAVGDVLVCFAGLSFTKQPPVASYHDLEHGSPFADQEYAGGLQACVIVRYHESPIGMYDELLWIPGAFRHPGNGKQAYRCTRAYVSKPLAVHSGRKNWNVPKAVMCRL